MILVYAMLALIVLALLLRRDFTAIAQVSFRGGWLSVAVVAGLFALQWTAVVFSSQRTLLQTALLILSHLALILLILLNHHVSGARLFAFGIFLNTLVMGINGGWMPITPENYQYVHPDYTGELPLLPPSSKNIILPQAETRLWFLSDMIPVALPWRRWMMSVGDVLLIAAAAQFLFQTTAVKPAKAARQSASRPVP